jgi:hypothetical protein
LLRGRCGPCGGELLFTGYDFPRYKLELLSVVLGMIADQAICAHSSIHQKTDPQSPSRLAVRFATFDHVACLAVQSTAGAVWITRSFLSSDNQSQTGHVDFLAEAMMYMPGALSNKLLQVCGQIGRSGWRPTCHTRLVLAGTITVSPMSSGGGVKDRDVPLSLERTEIL